MSMRRIQLQGAEPREGSTVDPAGLKQRFDAIRADLDVPEEFGADVLAEAEAAATSPADLPSRDETSVPFLTIDPPGSMDLDQAMHLERDGLGYRVRYAIADVPAFVKAGGAVDEQARRRGQTMYFPDGRAPLHPTVISEGAASLLEEQVRPAYVWDMRLDAEGEGTSAEVYRAMVRSTDRLDYLGVQKAVDSGSGDDRLMLLKEVGEKRIRLEVERGGSDLPMPEQEVVLQPDGTYLLSYRPPVPAEDWNAQISLMAGMAAAEMMMHARIGILRTMPEPDHRALQRLHRQARALGIDWPAEELYGDFLRTLDRTNPQHLALIHDATALFRGAGYTPFDGALPDQPEHAAVASPYAHVTAPLRRLVDRFGLVVCEALSSGADVPGWVRAALPALPEIMSASDRKAHAVERACADAVEAAALKDRVGEVFDAFAVDQQESHGRKGDLVVQVQHPAVVAHAAGEAGLGTQVRVTLVEADVATSTVRFEVVTQTQ